MQGGGHAVRGEGADLGGQVGGVVDDLCLAAGQVDEQVGLGAGACGGDDAGTAGCGVLDGNRAGACQVVCVNRLLILWLGRGSSVLDDVPVLAAVKLGRQVRVGWCVDRGCAPAVLAGMEKPRRPSQPGLAGHKVTSDRPGKARLSAP